MKKILLLFLLIPSLCFSQSGGITITNKVANGPIGTAAATVDKYNDFKLDQTTAGITLTVPNLTNTTPLQKKVLSFINIGSVAVTLSPGGVLDPVGSTASGVTLTWNGTQWSVISNGNQSVASYSTSITSPSHYGSSSSGGNLSLFSTSHATKGKINFGSFSAYDEVNDRLGIGVVSPAVKLHTISTGEQLRLGYDASNYLSTTISSIGLVTYNAVGTSNPGFVWNQFAVFNGSLTTNTSVGSAAFYLAAQNSTTNNTTQAELNIGGTGTMYSRSWMRGSTNFLPVAGSNYGSFVIGQQAATIASSGTHTLFAQAIFRPLSITSGAGTLANSATVYVEGSATGASNNYSVWVDNGVSRFDGDVQIQNSGTFALTAGSNIQFSTSTGTKIATATNQLLGFWNATPIVQPANTVAINDVLVNTGLRASGGTSNFSSNLSSTGTVTGTQFRLSSLNAAPSSASDTGTTGEIRIDANYIYICTATNTWKRVAIATW